MVSLFVIFIVVFAASGRYRLSHFGELPPRRKGAELDFFKHHFFGPSRLCVFAGYLFTVPSFVVRCGQPTRNSSSVGVTSESNSQPFSVTQNMSLFCMPNRPGM